MTTTTTDARVRVYYKLTLWASRLRWAKKKIPIIQPLVYNQQMHKKSYSILHLMHFRAKGWLGRKSLPNLAHFSLFWAEGEVVVNEKIVSLSTTKPTKSHVQPGKTQISLSFFMQAAKTLIRLGGIPDLSKSGHFVNFVMLRLFYHTRIKTYFYTRSFPQFLLAVRTW